MTGLKRRLPDLWNFAGAAQFLKGIDPKRHERPRFSFFWITAATIRGSLIALAVLALQIALRGRMPARWRYALWLPVIFVLASPILPQSRWSAENRLDLKMMRTIQIAPHTASGGQETGIARSGTLEGGNWMAPVNWRRAGTVGWLVGTTGVLAFALGSYLRTLRRMRDVAVNPDAALLAAATEVASTIGLPGLPQVLVSTAVHSPAVTGLWRPLLLLPGGFLDQGVNSLRGEKVFMDTGTGKLRAVGPHKAVIRAQTPPESRK
jgi:bla regulator protein BlaR1